MTAQFRPVWLVTDPISGARGSLGFLVEDDAGVVFLRNHSARWTSPGSRALAALVTELLEGCSTFEHPPIGLGPQVVFGEVAEVPQSALGGREWVASTVLSARAA